MLGFTTVLTVYSQGGRTEQVMPTSTSKEICQAVTPSIVLVLSSHAHNAYAHTMVYKAVCNKPKLTPASMISSLAPLSQMVIMLEEALDVQLARHSPGHRYKPIQITHTIQLC